MSSTDKIGKRERVARALYRSGALRLVMKARSRVRNPLSVLTYHSVADRAEPGFDEDVVDATPEQFRDQLDFVGRFYTVVGIDQVVAAMTGGAKLPKNPLLITFDDGYRTCLDVAMPMLQSRGMRATFFIATDYVDERRIYWWDRINYKVKNSDRTSLALTYPETVTIDLGDQRAALRALLKIIKHTPELDLPRFLEGLGEATGVRIDRALERELADRTIMTWDDVRALRDGGMDVQSHTRSHRVLQTLDEGQLDEELAGSREILERELDQPVRTIAYPVGFPISESSPVRAALNRSGYALGFTNATGVNYPWKPTDPWDVRRLSVERDSSMAMFVAKLAVPPLAYSGR